MADKKSYWDCIEPVWEVINIYEGPEIFLETFSRVENNIGLLYASHFCQSEICNGGFKQFFGNSTGVLAPEAIRGFEMIGMQDVAEIVRQALLLLGDQYPRDRVARREVLQGLEPSTFDRLNERFWELVGDDVQGYEASADKFTASRGNSQ
jgi:hypothetical protein